MELDGKTANEDDAEGTKQCADFHAQSQLHTYKIAKPSCYTGKGIDFASEDKRDIVHQDISDDTAASARDCSHRNRNPEGMTEGKRLLYADDIEESKADGVEDKPCIVVVDDVLTKHTDCQNSKGTANEVAAVCHPKRIEAKHEVANGSTTDSCRHTDNPSTEDVELFGAG